MDPIIPIDDWEAEWPAEKFGLDLDDVFKTLHYQHNTITIPLQDFEAFSCDVQEISKHAASRKELERLLCDRRKLWETELLEAFRNTAFQILSSPEMPNWESSLRMFRTRSLSAWIIFMAGLLPDHAATAQVHSLGGGESKQSSQTSEHNTKGNESDDAECREPDHHAPTRPVEPTLILKIDKEVNKSSKRKRGNTAEGETTDAIIKQRPAHKRKRPRPKESRGSSRYFLRSKRDGSGSLE
jgi:hypothetical protein